MGHCHKNHKNHKNHKDCKESRSFDKLCVNKVKVKPTGLIPKTNLSLPIPPGPFTIDHFQVGKDNVQLRSPEKWRVDQFVNFNLDVTGVQTITVDGIEYFGRMEDDYPVYLTYPLPLILDFYVPSKRVDNCGKQDFDFFADDSKNYIGELSLEENIYIQGTTFWQQGGPDGAPGLVEADYPNSDFSGYLSQVPDSNSLANKVLETPIGLWTGLQGIFLLDDLSTDAYDRLVSLKADLAVDLVGNAVPAYQLMSKIMGSYGVPVSAANSNTVSAADRKRAYDLIYSSSNVQLIKHYKCYSKRHFPKSTKENDIYNPNYSFLNIDTKYGPTPFVILAEPNASLQGQDLAENFASWGISTCIYSLSYAFPYNKVPGKTRTVTDIINSGNAFPDVTVLSPYTFYANNQNYSIQADSATDLNSGYVFPMGYSYETANSHTGTTSYEFNRDIIFNVLETAKNAVDVNGNVLSDFIRFRNMGVYGVSGGANALNGAHAIENETPGSFYCGIANDIVLSVPYLEDGLQNGAGDFFGGFTEALTFPGGLNYPVMFMEPETDWYSLNSDLNAGQRTVVGAAKTLQRIIRKTPVEIRSRTIYLTKSQSGHVNQATRGYMNNGNGSQFVDLTGYPFPDLPQLPNLQYDPVWGFKDITNLAGNVNASTMLAISIYFRSMLTSFETIRFNALNYLPFKFDVSPWDIPDADDYQWRKREYSQDLGGKFNIRLDTDKDLVELFDYDTELPVSNPVTADLPVGGVKYYYFDVTDPELEVIETNLSWIGVPNDGLSPDIDMELYSPSGTTVQVSYFQRPEFIRYDLTNVTDKIGTWFVGVFYYTGNPAVYTLTVNTGFYKIIVDREYDVPVPPGTVPPHPELAVTKRGVSMLNLPTSSTGLKPGDLYIDGGVIKIVM